MHETGSPGSAADGAQLPLRAPADPCGALLLKIQQGDEQAFEQLYRDQSSILLATALRVLRNRSLAEEVLQEIFTEVWVNCHSYRAQAGSGRAWLTTMCRRRAIDRVRAVQAQQNRDFTQGVKEAHVLEPDVQDTVLTQVEAARAQTALQTLPEEQATAIAMAYYQELSHSEIARRLDVPLGTVKSRIRDGMRRLRAQLGGAG
ncbi:sigma-70 family RNA polymerase sigma factor [Nesterenkonia sandarakina]|uniref:RNA polymerase ECF family sigma subunit n=1 Tax=Nesterenkonia sandarakina TaxID=272918 RepID=A0A2T0YQR6_9MICC|nr:sigma-70 family RNA polymerase sigma factor [Nesterenkonia sandarakina]PRZ17549.1 RNA polymerase ECF family sigma subunit [Nesterenkonia sandarakina]